MCINQTNINGNFAFIGTGKFQSDVINPTFDLYLIILYSCKKHYNEYDEIRYDVKNFYNKKNIYIKNVIMLS